MRATVLWDLVRDARTALGMVEYWHHGTGQFANIEYCDFCSYSKTHGHGQQCIITRLNTALDGATSTSKGVE